MEGPALSCTPTHWERKQEAARMSVIPRQEVPGRWPPFNAAIIVTIVWIDNHAHYREMRGEKGRKLEALRLLVWGYGLFCGGLTDGVKGGNVELRRDVLPLGCMGKLVCSKRLHLIWVSQSNYVGRCFQGEERLTQARGQDRTTLRPTRERETVYSLK